MFEKVLIVLMIGCFLLGMATKAEVEGVKEEVEKEVIEDSTTVEVNAEKVYKIQVSGEGEQGDEKEINFISPEGDVLKNIRFDYSVSKAGDLWHIESTNLEAISEDKSKVIISEESWKSRYNPDELTDYPGYEGEIWDYTVKLMSGMGEVKFTKQFKTYPGNDPTASYFKTLFSRQGNAVLFFYRDSEHIFHIEVYDTEGNNLAEASNENYLSNLQISPDGKIVGAETEKKVGKAWLRHLFFLDVETGKTKVVKAEGKRWLAGFSLLSRIPTPEGYRNLTSKHIDFVWEIEGKRGSKILVFDQLPNDLSTLFGKER